MDENNNVIEQENVNEDQKQNDSEEQVKIPEDNLKKSETTNYESMNNQQPYRQSYIAGDEMEKPVSVGEWMLTSLVMLIPFVNFIMMFVWAFSSKTKKSKSNYFKAALIWMLIWIGVVLAIVVALAIVVLVLYNYQA